MRSVKILKENYQQYLFLLLSFSLPLWQRLSTIILLVLVCLSLLKIRNIHYNKDFLPLFTLYFIYIISEVIHPPINFDVFEMKSSLLALPLVLMLNKPHKGEIRKSYKFYVFGIIVACFFCYINAAISSISFENGFEFKNQVVNHINDSFLESSVFGGNHFFGNYFSIFHQTVYFSIYLNIALLIVLFTDIFKKTFKYVFIVFVFIVIFQVSNRVNIILYLFVIIYWIFFTIKKDKTKFLILSFCCLLGLLILFFNPRTNKLFRNVMDTELFLDRESEDSFGTRLLVWDASLSIIKDNFIKGVGVSNTYKILKKVYKEKRYVVPFRNRLNAHNQYFQITIECGIIGLSVLFLVLRKLLKSKKRYKLLNIGFLVLIIINFLFESVFSRYSGLVCFAFFYCTLLYLKKDSIVDKNYFSE